MVDNFESVLLVAFLHLPPPSGALRLWATAFDEEPTGYQTPGPGPSVVPAHANVQGIVGDYAIRLVVQPGRVDLSISAPDSMPPNVPSPPLGDLQSAIDFAIARMSKLLPILKVGRTAMVIQGYTVTESEEKSVDAIRSWLPNVAIPAGSTDLTYQVTVPFASKVQEGRKLNQLCRWQSVQMQIVEFQIGAAPPKQINSAFAALAYIDVFGRDMEEMDGAMALEALNEVAGRAKVLVTGGIDGLN